MIVEHWSERFKSLYSSSWPENYCVVDCEYTGGNEEVDVVTGIGHLLVENGKPVDHLSLVLDWTHHPIVPADWLQHALRRVTLNMANSGRVFHTDWDGMQRDGIAPEKALTFYYDLFEAVKARGGMFVAHNGFYADERMLRGNFEGFIGKTFRFGENRLFDTGAIEKASLALVSSDPAIRERRDVWLPNDNDTMETYFRRVTGAHAKGLFWNLSDTIRRHGLHTRHNLDLDKAHAAGFDVQLVYHLMEHYRELAAAKSGERIDSSAEFAKMFEKHVPVMQQRAARQRGQRPI